MPGKLIKHRCIKKYKLTRKAKYIILIIITVTAKMKLKERREFELDYVYNSWGSKKNRTTTSD